MVKHAISTDQGAVRLDEDLVRSPRFADPTTLLCCALCTLTFAYWSHGLTGALTFPGLAFLALLPPTLFLLGRGLLGLVRFPRSPSHPFPIAFVVGALAASILLFFLNLFSPLSLRGNGLVVLVAAALLQVRPSGVAGPRIEGSSKLYAILVVALALAASTLWTQDLRPYVVEVGDSVRLRPWADYLVHASTVAQFCADRSIWSMGDPDLSGQRLPFYHYASYLLPACVSVWSGQSACDSLATFWIPFGFLLAGLAAYVLASELWGDAAGLSAFLGVMLVPDSSTYGVRCGWYSFHWLLATSAGLLYGIAGGAIVLLLIVKGIRPTRWSLIVAGVVLAFLNILLKAHIFVIGFPVLAAWFVLYKEGWTIGRRAAVGFLILMTAGAGIVAADRLKIGPVFLLLRRYHGIDNYIRFVAATIPTEAWGGAFASLRDEGSSWEHPLLTLLLVVGGPFGALVLAYPLLLILSKRLGKARPEDTIPALSLAFYLYLVFLTPHNYRGASDELWHRPFVWVYFLLASWCWGKAAHLLTTSRFGAPKLLPAALALAGLALLVAPWQRGKVVQAVGARTLPGYVDAPLPPDLLACAAFLRDHSSRLDVVQYGDPDDLMDFAVPVPVLAGFAERRSYLGRPLSLWTQFAVNPSGRIESVRRYEVLEDLRKADSPEELADFADQTGIRWYVAAPAENLEWPAEFLDHPAYVSGRYRVYEFPGNRGRRSLPTAADRPGSRTKGTAPQAPVRVGQ